MNLLFAWRYFRSPKSTNAINIIAWVSMAAIVVGSAALIIVLSVFNGFEDLVKSLYSTFYTDLKILPSTGKTFFLSPGQLKKLQSSDFIKAFSLIAEDKALLQNGELQSLVVMKGVDSNYTKVTSIINHIGSGRFELGNRDTPAVVLGSGVENALGVQGDRSILPVTAYLFKKGSAVNTTDPLQSLSSANISTAGTFIIQQDLDNKYVITNLPFVQQMLNLQQNEFSGIEISVRNSDRLNEVQRSLQDYFGNQYSVLNRYQQNPGLYHVMKVERWVIYIILTLILIVAAFNMVGALTMLVIEKQKDIQVLKAMGSDERRIQKIFLNEGVLLGILGCFGGILIAVLICWMQIKFHLVPIEGGTFIINYYPVKMQGTDFALVVMTVLVVTVLASWFPARRAAHQPIELRT